MKFLVIFVISVVALAAASKMPSREKLKALLEKSTTKRGMTCENHVEFCDRMVARHKTDLDADMRNKLFKSCLSIARQYLCEGKKEGEPFADVYEEIVQLLLEGVHLRW